jgi:hypothetical protein
MSNRWSFFLFTDYENQDDRHRLQYFINAIKMLKRSFLRQYPTGDTKDCAWEQLEADTKKWSPGV